MITPIRHDNLILTPQPDAALQAVRISQSHLTASEVYQAARKILPSISSATVCNSLRYPKDRGLIGEVQFGNGVSRYDRMIDRHDHALCTGCGKTVDLEMELADELRNRAARCQVLKRTASSLLSKVCATTAAQNK